MVNDWINKKSKNTLHTDLIDRVIAALFLVSVQKEDGNVQIWTVLAPALCWEDLISPHLMAKLTVFMETVTTYCLRLVLF